MSHQIKYYKVCRIVNLRYWSCVTGSVHAVEYLLNEEVKPKNPEWPLLVFSDLMSADSFLGKLVIWRFLNHSFKVFECDVTNPRPIKWIPETTSFGVLWENIFNGCFSGCVKAPENTVAVDSVKLIKEI